MLKFGLHMIRNMSIVSNKYYSGVMCLWTRFILIILLDQCTRRIECNGFMALCIVWSNIIAGEYTLVNIFEIYLPRDFGSFFLVSYCNFEWSAVTDEWDILNRYINIYLRYLIFWKDYLLWVCNVGGWYHCFGYFQGSPIMVRWIGSTL